MADRFDLEQEILRCWNIIEDIREIDDLNKHELIKPTLEFYNHKFDKMWEMFEDCIHSEFSYKKQLNELQKQNEELQEEIYKLRDKFGKEPFKHYTGSFTSGRTDINYGNPF